MAMILPRAKTFGQSAMEGLGTGLGSGLQALAKMKLDQMQKQQQVNEALPFAKKLFPDMDEEGVRGLLMAPPHIQKGYMQERAGGSPKMLAERRKHAAAVNRPEYNKSVTDSQIAEKGIPFLQEMIGMVGKAPTGFAKAASKVWGNDVINEYNALAGQYAAATGMKAKDLPSMDLPPDRLKQMLRGMIEGHNKTLMKKEAIQDIIAENDGFMPTDLFNQADKRVKLREHQQKKSTVRSGLPEASSPHLESQRGVDITPDSPQGYAGEVAANAPTPVDQIPPEQLTPDQQVERYGAPFPDIEPGTTQLESRTPSLLEKIENLTGTPVISSPIGRNIGRGLRGAAAGTLDLAALPVNLLSKLTGGATPRIPAGKDVIGKKVFGPTLETPYLGKRASEGDKQRQRVEDIASTIAEEFGELIGPGLAAKGITSVIGKIANIPKWLKSAESFLKVSPKAARLIVGTSNAAKEAVKAAGAPEFVQDTVKALTGLGAAASSSRLAQLKAADMKRTLNKTIQKGNPITDSGLRSMFYRAIGKIGDKDRLRSPFIDVINNLPIENMPASKIWSIRQFLENAKKSKASPAFVEYIPKIIDRIDKSLGAVNKGYLKLMTDYEGLSKVKDTTSKLYDFYGKIVKKGGPLTPLLYGMGYYSKYRLIAKAGVGGLAAGIGAAELERSLRALKNPVFRRKFGGLIKAGLASTVQRIS